MRRPRERGGVEWWLGWGWGKGGFRLLGREALWGFGGEFPFFVRLRVCSV